MIITENNFSSTITAEAEDWWECACGNDPLSGLGFIACSPTGRIMDTVPNDNWSDWDGKLNACLECGLVMDQTTFDQTTQTVAIVGRIQDHVAAQNSHRG